jgi:uncharacterized protein YcfL
MKTKIICLLCALALIGCATKKEVTEKKKSIDTNVTVEQEKKTEIYTDSMLNRIDGMTAEWEFNLEEFDTEQPIDSVTGTPPLKKRIKGTIKQRREVTTAAKVQTTIKKNEVLKTAVKAKSKETEKVTVDYRNYWKAYMIILLLIFAICLYIWNKII